MASSNRTPRRCWNLTATTVRLKANSFGSRPSTPPRSPNSISAACKFSRTRLGSMESVRLWMLMSAQKRVTTQMTAARASRAWAWKSISKDGGRLAFGSDWPVVTLNPWEGMQTAVTRQTTDGKPESGFVPEQRLTVEETVRGYTLGAAYAGRREKTEGSIERGKLADIIIVSQNIFEIDPHHLAETRVLTTMVGGRVVYQAPAK